MNIVHMISSQITIQICFCTVRINPGMKLHTSFMTFINHKLHRIPIRRGSLSLHPRQKTAPGFQLWSIQCICLRTHLKDYSINTSFLQRVQLLYKRLFQLFGRHTLELPINGLYPCSTKFTFRISSTRGLCSYSQRQEKDKQNSKGSQIHMFILNLLYRAQR